ncbi:MAG: hypothetical protein RDA78_13325 [Roseibium sp.]
MAAFGKIGIAIERPNRGAKRALSFIAMKSHSIQTKDSFLAEAMFEQPL